MKNLIQLAALILIVSMSACSTVEDQAPSEDLSVTTVNEEFDFSGNNIFQSSIDINNDGTVDFALIGYRGQLPGQPELGNMTMVRLKPTTDRNQITSEELVTFQACNMNLEYYPSCKVEKSTTINAENNSWNRESMLYVHMVTSQDCSHYVKHFTTEEVNTIGVRFMNEGYLFYGWVNLKATDLSESGCPDSAEVWTVLDYGYNKIPEQGIMVK